MSSVVFAFVLLAGSQLAGKTLSPNVDGVERTALVFAPSSAQEARAPLVFAWHGHGGGSRQAALSFHIHREWPEAIVVYPQGLPTSGRTDPDGKKAGWQIASGGVLADRDLKFFDALLAKIKSDYKVDDKRIYCMGHSNGGRFTYVLWQARGDVFAAFGPSGSPAIGMVRFFKPKSVFHIAGENDQLVPYQGQKATIGALRRLLGIAETANGNSDGYYHSEMGKNGNELVTFIHPGGHEYPQAAIPYLVEFFKRHSK